MYVIIAPDLDFNNADENFIELNKILFNTWRSPKRKIERTIIYFNKFLIDKIFYFIF